ncbi:MAG: hypothetical protein NTV73_03440, partial [Hyphomicrobiales bacterium]|nr:hypothetical protein [Hyphomicrobiales bacterium]
MAKRKSSITSLWRLFWTFGRAYRGHIIIGVLTGILLGGAVFGILKSSVALLRPFDLGAAIARHQVQPAPALAPPGADDVAAVAPGAAKATGRRTESSTEWLDRGLAWAERLGIGHVERD